MGDWKRTPSVTISRKHCCGGGSHTCKGEMEYVRRTGKWTVITIVSETDLVVNHNSDDRSIYSKLGFRVSYDSSVIENYVEKWKERELTVKIT